MVKMPKPEHRANKRFVDEDVPLGGKAQSTGGDVYRRYMNDYSKNPKRDPNDDLDFGRS